LATQHESIFWNLVALALEEHGYSPCNLEWEEWSQTYRLRVNRLGVPYSERDFNIFKDQFSASVSDGRLNEAILRNLLDAVAPVAVEASSAKRHAPYRTGH
jgi:hypothetical protein